MNLFVSYARLDAALVVPVVGLLRATNLIVFRDVDTIQPGKKWQAAIDEGLNTADIVVVFWCGHSTASLKVREEYEAAISARKDVLPILLDGTPLPAALAPYQFIDFRGLVGEHLHAPSASVTSHDHVHSVAARAGFFSAKKIGAVLLILLAGVFGWSMLSPVHKPASVTPPGPVESAPSTLGIWVIGGVLLIALISLLIFIIRKARNASRQPHPPAVPQDAVDGEFDGRTQIGRPGGAVKDLPDSDMPHQSTYFMADLITRELERRAMAKRD